MIEFKKVTTRGGDGGESGLANGERRPKDDLLFEAMGDIDELSSFLGVARASCGEGTGAADHPELLSRLIEIIDAIQRNLLSVGAQIASPPADPHHDKLRFIADRHVEELESFEAEYLERTKIGGRFVLQGEGTTLSAHFDVARAVCRRAERRVVACIRERALTDMGPAQRYLNRLADFLFVVARYVDQAVKIQSNS